MLKANVIRALIASPSDTSAARAVLREALEDWNSLNAEDGSVVLPLMWERDATPELGAPPQRLINRQLVDKCDVVIALFWTRLGTPTADGQSGTVEEVERGIQAEKPVLVYFSREPVVPDSVDADEYKRLAEFRDSLRERGLYAEFETPEELRRRVSADITRVVRDRFGGAATDPIEFAAPGADLLARIDSEREVRGFDTRGRPQYTTRWTLTIENRGTAPAQDLTFELEVESEEEPAPSLMEADKPVGILPPGGVVSYPLLAHMGTARQFDIIMRWRQGDSERSQTQTLRL